MVIPRLFLFDEGYPADPHCVVCKIFANTKTGPQGPVICSTAEAHFILKLLLE